MLIEEEQIGISQSDKRVVLEAIKRSLLEDMHHRMDVFFSGKEVEKD
jgi:hypothetical protein